MIISPQAVIEIGSTGIRLLVAEITDDRKRNILDRSEVPVSIGRDVFTTRTIKQETLQQCILILRRFSEQLEAWGILPEQTTVIGTSAVREAKNRDPFVDRIKVKTRFTVRVIDGIEENRLMYIAVTECLKDESYSVQQSDSIILDITGGSTEIMLMNKGRMMAAHSMRLGTVIIEQQLHSLFGNIEDAQRYIEEFIHTTKNTLKAEMSLDRIKQFIALGGDMKLAALFSGKAISPFLWEIPRESFEEFVDEIKSYTPEECVAMFKLNFNEAQTFQISLLAYRHFMALTNVKSIIVPETSLREGLVISQIGEVSSELRQEFNSQITASAASLLHKYQGDERHAEYVRDLSLRLYDSMQTEIGMDDHVRTLLEVSALLHDIGMFIKAEDHNIHSRYIVQNSEIFGLSHDDRNLVAMIVGYHKGRRLPQDDEDFRLLPRTSRMIVLKLSAILRVADAMDRSHMQKSTNYTINFSQNTLTFRIKGHSNLTLEKLALQQKGDLFETVLGYKIVII